ncbi:MAG: alpha/beta hydrolase [Deltaproteobacteria bacterium]|nr:alpha/beta hydrolase [Deltaproteobacteria bacterium]
MVSRRLDHLELYVRIARTLAATAVRRTTRGPRQPSWSLPYETMISVLRDLFTADFFERLPGRRNIFQAGSSILRRSRSDAEEFTIAGRRALWLGGAHDRGVVLYLHGGGYVFGSIKTHRSLMTVLARAGQCRVLGIDYRLAPEHPCPAAIDDAVAGYEHLLELYDASEIVIAGDSAGGGLTVTTMLALRERGLPLPAAAVLLSPWTDLRTDAGVPPDLGYDYLKPAPGWGQPYAGSLDTSDPRVSPVLAELSGLPPMLVLSGALELLLDDNIAFVEAARRAGCDVEHHVEPEQVHVYPAFFQFNRAARAGVSQIGEFVRRRLSRQS